MWRKALDLRDLLQLSTQIPFQSPPLLRIWPNNLKVQFLPKKEDFDKTNFKTLKICNNWVTLICGGFSWQIVNFWNSVYGQEWSVLVDHLDV